MTDVVTRLVVRADGSLATLGQFEKGMEGAGKATDYASGAVASFEKRMAAAKAATEQGLAVSTQSVARKSQEERAWEKWSSTVDRTTGLRIKLEREAATAAATAANAVNLGYTSQEQALSTLSALERRHTAQLSQHIAAENGVAAAYNRTAEAADQAAVSTRRMAAANGNRSGAGSFNTSNIAAQFQDIGVTASMGMSPMMIALQQGTQLSAVFEQMKRSGEGTMGVMRGLGAAFASIISPISLITIGVVALGAAGIQAFMGWLSSSQKAANGVDRVTQALADQAAPVDSIKGKITELQSITDTYAKAIRGTAKDQDIATKSIIANSEREFNAKKSLLELELKRQRAAIAVQEAEIAIAGRSLARDVRAVTPTGIIDPVAGGTSDPRIGDFVRSRQQSNLIETTQSAINANPINDQLKEMHANLDLARISTDGLGEALGTTFNEGVAVSVGRIASTATTAAETAAKKYQDLIRTAQQRIDMAGVEQSTIGMTTEEIARMTIEQELLNKAANDHIALLPGQTEEISNLANGIAAAEEQTRRLTDIYDTGKAIFGNFFSELKAGLKDGKGLWESLGAAASNALDTITSKALEMAANGIFDMIFRAIFPSSTGGGSHSLGSGLASLFGGGRANGGPVEPGMIYRVNENTPNSEWFSPSVPGTIIPRLPAAANPRAANGNSLSVVRIELSDDVEGRILEQSGQQSVQIVRAAAPGIAEQGASGAGSKLAKGDFDGSMGRFGVSPQAKRR